MLLIANSKSINHKVYSNVHAKCFCEICNGDQILFSLFSEFILFWLLLK